MMHTKLFKGIFQMVGNDCYRIHFRHACATLQAVGITLEL